MTRPGDYPIPVAIQEGSSIPLAEDAATASNQVTVIEHIDGIEGLLAGTLTVDTGLTPLTDTQLRASAVPISGTVTANTGLTQPLTDTQLRASAVPVSVASLPLPSSAATDSTLGQVRDRIGSRAAATYPEVLIAFWNAYSLTGTGSSADLNTSEIDWAGGTLQGVDAIRVTGFTTNNGTAPGSTATFTLNLYWSDVQVSLANVPTELADRKQVLFTKTLPNSANATRYWNFSGTSLILPRARYLYLSVDKSAFASSASSALTVYLVRG